MELRAADLDELRGLLEADHERSIGLIASLTQNVATIVESARLTATDDEHDPEGSTIAFERSQAGALITSTRDHLADVDGALDRIDHGTYGWCERCGETIGRERLLARPSARTCIACASSA